MLMEVLTLDVALNAHPLYPGWKKEKEILVMELYKVSLLYSNIAKEIS